MLLIEKSTGVKFPPRSVVTNFAETPPIDPTWVARVVLGKDSRGKLLSALSTKKEEKMTVVGATSDTTIWWKPQKTLFERRYVTPSRDGDEIIQFIVSEESGELVAYVERDLF